jgi:signal transduction histidine kinase
LRSFLKRNLLWVALGLVLLPLGVMLHLQYGWLVSLQKTSAIAEKSLLSNYLAAVSQEVEAFYYKQAWKTLNVPEDFFLYKDLDKVRYYFDKWDVAGVKYLFVADYTKGNDWGQVRFYDPRTRELAMPDDPAVARATMVAMAPWKTLAYSGASLQSHELTVEEKDPQNRILIRPISQYQCKIVGVAGMVLDNGYFREIVLPRAIERALPHDLVDGAKRDLIVTVRDERDRLVYGSEPDEAGVEMASYRIPGVFSDWKLGLASHFETPEQLARSNFLLNLSLSLLLAVVLLGGIVVALRTASREMKLSQMKSDFVSNVSHELRTPLASIRVFGEFLRLGRVRGAEKVAEYGEYIETESRRLSQLINNILDFSKIESGAKTYQFERADLRETVAETLRSLGVSLRHNGFELEVVDRGEALPEVELDADAMAQALANLVDNAVKYSNGSKRVRVEIGRDGDGVFVAVRDRGVGISRSEQAKIFDRFHRVSTGLVHDVKGSGLGLSIVRHVVQAHGGSVEVQSELGQGSTFTIRLPGCAPDVVDDETLIAPAGRAEPVGKT